MVPPFDTFWVVEANHQQVLNIALGGTVTRIADLSVLGNVAPAGLTLSPQGGVYVGLLSALPFAEGSAKGHPRRRRRHGDRRLDGPDGGNVDRRSRGRDALRAGDGDWQQ
jgi:hypothetical protein